MADGLELDIEVVPASALPEGARAEVVALCDRAFGVAMAPYLSHLGALTHVIGRLEGAIVSHAAWVTRRLQVGSAPLLRTAYVEMVATEPGHQRRGYGTAVMQRLMESIQDFEMGALSASDAGRTLYQALGWQEWRGPRFIRGSHELIPTPNERIMVLRLPKTPYLDLDAMLTAEWREGELW